MSPVFRHGSLRLYLLRLLDEEPRHGYEVIRLLRDRFMGVYSPSPGTIYPRLARLDVLGVAGASSKPMSPWRCHPTAASQVHGGETGGGSDIEELALHQPVNHGAEEHGSIPPTPGRCLRQF